MSNASGGDRPAGWSPEYEAIVERLTSEFAGVHRRMTVSRCVEAACHGAEDVTGSAAPGLVERIARRHLHVLALVAAEQR